MHGIRLIRDFKLAICVNMFVHGCLSLSAIYWCHPVTAGMVFSFWLAKMDMISHSGGNHKFNNQHDEVSSQ